MNLKRQPPRLPRTKILVDRKGVEPLAFRMQSGCSAIELPAHIWCGVAQTRRSKPTKLRARKKIVGVVGIGSRKARSARHGTSLRPRLYLLRFATEYQILSMSTNVGVVGIEPTTSSLSETRSTIEPHAH